MTSDSHLPPGAREGRRGFLRRASAGAAGLVAVSALAGVARAAGSAAEADFWQAVPGTEPARSVPAALPVATAAPAAEPAPAAGPTPAAEPARRLALVNAHTGERFEGAYRVRGMYIDESVAELEHLLRDHRAERAHAIDPALFDTLHALHARLGTDQPFRVLSGYRTPETNARLRRRSSGVAKFSLHMEGRAVDVHVPGLDARAVQREALALARGGVGYYARSGFVHLDTGEVRAWRG